MEELRQERKRLAADFDKLAAELTERRGSAARKLEKRSRPNWPSSPWSARSSVLRLHPLRGPPRAPTASDFLVSPNLAKSPAIGEGGFRRRDLAAWLWR